MFRWLGYLAVNLIVASALVYAGLRLASYPLTPVLLVAGVVFFLRGINHPDYYLRRIVTGLASLATGNLLVFPLAPLLLQRWPGEVPSLLVEWVGAYLAHGYWVVFACALFAVVFAILDLRRTSQGRLEQAAEPFIQVTQVDEVSDGDSGDTVLVVHLTAHNPTDRNVVLTNARVTVFGLWNRTLCAEVEDNLGAAFVPLETNNGISIDAGSQRTLALRKRYRRDLRTPPPHGWLARLPFIGAGLRRRGAAFSTRLGAGPGMTVFDDAAVPERAG